jgi:hypothetical protein
MITMVRQAIHRTHHPEMDPTDLLLWMPRHRSEPSSKVPGQVRVPCSLESPELVGLVDLFQYLDLEVLVVSALLELRLDPILIALVHEGNGSHLRVRLSGLLSRLERGKSAYVARM